MSTRNRTIEFRCDNDCKMSGCPGHKLKGLLQTTSDCIIIEDEEGNIIYSGDINKTIALLKIIYQLDYDSLYFREEKLKE